MTKKAGEYRKVKLLLQKARGEKKTRQKKKSEGFERYLATIELFELARVSKKKIMLLDPSGNL